MDLRDSSLLSRSPGNSIGKLNPKSKVLALPYILNGPKKKNQFYELGLNKIRKI